MQYIEARDLTVIAGQLSLDVPHLRFDHVKTTCVIGRSGSGKSLFAAALSGLPVPGLDVSGEISADGQLQPSPLWKDQVFVIPQEPAVALDPTMSVGAQLAEVFRWRLDPACPWATPDALCEAVGLNAADLAKFPEQLSGGMQQRIMIAMSLAARASFVVADEPTKGLDTDSKARVIGLFKMIQATGRGLIVITHDLDVARALADRVVVFDQGKVVESGTAERVLKAPKSPVTLTLIQNTPENWQDQVKSTGAMPEPVLSLKDVSFGFSQASHVIADASIDVHAGEIVGLYGPSGVGKSTLGDLCLGLHRPTHGTVRWFGEPITPAAIRQQRPKFQKLFQNPVTSFPPNLMLGDVLKKLTPISKRRSISRSELMSRLKLDEALLRRRPDQVSGGELQRLAIVRVMLAQPRFLVCDEPSSRLDMSIQRLAIEIITDYVGETDAAILLISHDREVLRKRADHVFALSKKGVLKRVEVAGDRRIAHA